MPIRSRPEVFALAVIAVATAMRAPAAAHVQPVPIERWGEFSSDTVTCLRLVDRATHACFDNVLPILQSCEDARARGAGCDEDETDAQVFALASVPRDTLTGQCNTTNVTDLGYLGFADSQADLFSACVSQARNAIAAIYAPARTRTPSQADLECIAAAAAYGRKVMRFALQQLTPANERIAARAFSAAEKVESLQRVESRLAAARERWVDGLLEACPDFAAVYGRSADSFLRTLRQRADCVLSSTNIHTAINCPSQICGNGIPEGAEECDDGNRDDTDACLSSCRRNESGS